MRSPGEGPVALTDLGGESHSVSHPATPHPAAVAPAQPSKGPLRSALCLPVRRNRVNPLSPCANGVHISACRAQMSAPPPHPTPPQALLQKPRRVWLGGGESSFVLCLDKGAPAFPKPHRCEELVTLVFVQPY